VLSPDSQAAAVFEVWWQNFLRPAVLAALGIPPQALQFMINPTTGGIGDQNTIFEVLEGLDPRLGPDPIGARNSLVLSSLAQAKQFMELYGLAGQTWGQLHGAFLNHPLSPAVDPATQELLNIGPQMPRGGSGDTVNATFHVFLMTQDFRVLAGASWRMVLDPGCWDSSLAMNAPGQSGDPNNTHYDDLFPGWAQDEAFPLLYSRPLIARSARERIHLLPR
jgi:penicillin amidase